MKDVVHKKIVFSYTPADGGMPTSYIDMKERLDEPSSGSAVNQIRFDSYKIEGNENFKGEVIIDLNEKGEIIGIEILGNVIPDNLRE